MLVHFDKPMSATEIKDALEGNDTPLKIQAMKNLVMMLLNQEQLPHSLFITIVRYVLPSEDHTVQRLLLLYLEIIEKTDSAGKLLPEMILICQNLRNNLQHPNEYLRGSTLKFLCRIKNEEILEPLVSSVLTNLDHRHSYVRKNAVLAIDAMYQLPKGEMLLPDAPELMENFLRNEQDLSSRRNAFAMLATHAEDRAVRYLLENVEQVHNYGDLLQMAVLELIVKVCKSKPEEKGKYLKVILSLLQSRHSSVVYEGSVALVSLSQAPTAIRAAAGCLTNLLVSHSDNNVKLIVLDRIAELKEQHRDVMQEMLMDVLRALSSPNLDLRQKTLDLALDMLTSKNVEEVVGTEYRQLLVKAIHSCAIRFPIVAESVVHVLMDYLGDSNATSALDVAFFVREILETNPRLRESIFQQLLESFNQIRSTRVCSCALWIMGEFSLSSDEIHSALDCIKEALGPLPLVAEPSVEETTEEKEEEVKPKVTPISTRPAVLADGTYATQMSVVETAEEEAAEVSTTNLRTLLMSGDFFIGSVCIVSLTKMALRLSSSVSKSDYNRFLGETLYLAASILRLGSSNLVPYKIDDDNQERIALCVRVLINPESEMARIWLQKCRSSFVSMLTAKQKQDDAEAKSKEAQQACQPDETIPFPHLKSKKGYTQPLHGAPDISLATIGDSRSEDSKLNRILQLTGLSDPLFAEAYVTVHQYDIVLDISVKNRSDRTMQNLNIELATMGDLKLVERPQNYTLAPGDQKVIRANIKVSSTETGIIFGNVVYESGGYSDSCIVILNDIHIDIMDYIHPASCADTKFRSMWAEFEWENKVAVNTDMTDPTEYLNHIASSTNMKILTSPNAMEGVCGYLAANLYAQSVFGEDALVNVSIEKQADEKLGGCIRIRSKTQGIALSLGDKITVRQKQ
eukprot:g2931.t1